MKNEEILAVCDHTLLSPETTFADIRKVLDDAMRYRTASACIPPRYVREAKAYVGDRLPVCTVIGFPNGYMTTEVKVYETRDAVANGADEIDMVINIGDVKAGNYDGVREEIRAVRAACEGKILKVIIETCLLTDAEKIRLAGVVAEGGADFIKTSTGFSRGGATVADVALLRRNAPAGLKVKAAGGISTLRDAEEMIRAGADRLGTSRVVKIIKEETGETEK